MKLFRNLESVFLGYKAPMPTMLSASIKTLNESDRAEAIDRIVVRRYELRVYNQVERVYGTPMGEKRIARDMITYIFKEVADDLEEIDHMLAKTAEYDGPVARKVRELLNKCRGSEI